MASEAELLEIKELGEAIQKSVGELETRIKEKASTEDVETRLKGIETSYDTMKEELKKKGENLDQLIVRMNRENLPDASKGQTKGYYDQIKAGLEEKITKGGFGKAMKGETSFELPTGQGAIHQKAVGDMTNTNLSGGYAVRDIRPDIISLPFRKQRVRSLINVGATSASIIEYLRHTGGEGGVAVQAEGALKSQIDFDFQMVQETIKTIAVFAVVSKQMLADIPRLANFITNQLTNKWFDFEDNQLIYGDGTGDNFKGLLNQAPSYVPTDGTENTYFEYLVDAISQIENINFEATGIIMNPLDFKNLLTYKSKTGEFNHPGLIYGADNVLRLYGTPIIKNNAIAKGTGLTGDFTQAEILVRDGLSFDMSYEDSDNFRKNKVTLRLEAREGFTVTHPTAFRELDFTPLSGI